VQTYVSDLFAVRAFRLGAVRTCRTLWPISIARSNSLPNCPRRSVESTAGVYLNLIATFSPSIGTKGAGGSDDTIWELVLDAVCSLEVEAVCGLGVDGVCGPEIDAIEVEVVCLTISLPFPFVFLLKRPLELRTVPPEGDTSTGATLADTSSTDRLARGVGSEEDEDDGRW
jgi:hypothetical protein